ncbi:hypothetical protein EDB84DRAFT_1617887 [Lactarius hengduanensis]|nr:hypothetical protein EDB84DRAFT_1617887 [Lactarius hengduanensis]
MLWAASAKIHLGTILYDLRLAEQIYDALIMWDLLGELPSYRTLPQNFRQFDKNANIGTYSKRSGVYGQLTKAPRNWAEQTIFFVIDHILDKYVLPMAMDTVPVVSLRVHQGLIPPSWYNGKLNSGSLTRGESHGGVASCSENIGSGTRDYHGSAKPVRVTGTGHAGTGQGSHSRTRAKPVPMARVPAGRFLSSHTLLALQLHIPSLCTSFDAESSSIVRWEVAVGDAKPLHWIRIRRSKWFLFGLGILTCDGDDRAVTTTTTTREYDNDHADEATPSTPSTSDHNDHGGQATTTRQLRRRRRRGLPVVIPGFTFPSLLFGLGIQVAITTTSTVTADRNNDMSTITPTRPPLRLLRRGDRNDHGDYNGSGNGLYTPAGTGNPPNPQVLTKPVNTRTRMRGYPYPWSRVRVLTGTGTGKAKVTRGLPVVIPIWYRESVDLVPCRNLSVL